VTAPATHLTWSDEIGKRVRTGDWTDQAVSTVTKIREALRESGDTLGVAVRRREFERIGRTKPLLPVIQPGPGR